MHHTGIRVTVDRQRTDMTYRLGTVRAMACAPALAKNPFAQIASFAPYTSAGIVQICKLVTMHSITQSDCNQ